MTTPRQQMEWMRGKKKTNQKKKHKEVEEEELDIMSSSLCVIKGEVDCYYSILQ